MHHQKDHKLKTVDFAPAKGSIPNVLRYGTSLETYSRMHGTCFFSQALHYVLPVIDVMLHHKSTSYNYIIAIVSTRYKLKWHENLQRHRQLLNT
jgi:hypothetical protein